MKALKHILRKIDAIRYGMLRSKQDHKQLSVQVEATTGDEGFCHWLVTDNLNEKLVNKQVSLVQKYEDDYIYITGKVASQRTASHTILSVQIMRACWMVRRSKGNLTWLDEKYVYDVGTPELRIAS